MPRYDYKCESCGELYQLVHSINEKATDCEKCSVKNSLIRLPSFLTIKIKKENYGDNKKPGDLVKEYIEDTKKEIKEYKKEQRREHKNE